MRGRWPAKVTHGGSDPPVATLLSNRTNSAGIKSPGQSSKNIGGTVPPDGAPLSAQVITKSAGMESPGWVRSANEPGGLEPPGGPGERGLAITNTYCGPQPPFDSSARRTGTIMTNVPQVPAVSGDPRLAGPLPRAAPDQYGCQVDMDGPGDAFGTSQRTAKRSRGRG